MKALLQTHAASGAGWHAPGFHSGYNEVILNSPAHNAHLPHSILGFFVPKGAGPITADLGYGIVIDVVQVHRAFLAKHGLTETEVPMLELDPYNWDAPFSHYHR